MFAKSKTLPFDDPVALSDFLILFGLTVLSGISWLVPEKFWPGFCQWVSSLVVRKVTSNPETISSNIEKCLKHGSRRNGTAVLQQLAGEHVLMLLQMLRDYRPGGWQPDIRIDGAAHLETALANGNGAILWIGFTFQADLVAKMAFRRLDLHVHHLSRPSHGFSQTRFGRTVLNRIQTHIENRYIDKRVLLDADDPKPALDALAQHLSENGVVSITARRDARRPVEIPFGDGRLYLAPGAPVLSLRTGAALLPTIAYRDLDGRLRMDIHAPLAAPPALSRRDGVSHLVERYAEILRPFLRRYPGQWIGWLHL